MIGTLYILNNTNNDDATNTRKVSYLEGGRRKEKKKFIIFVKFRISNNKDKLLPVEFRRDKLDVV